MGEEKIEFAVFCIENIAQRLHKDGAAVYEDLTEKSNLLFGYILPNYEILHTQGRDYIVEDIIELMREDGLCA